MFGSISRLTELSTMVPLAFPDRPMMANGPGPRATAWPRGIDQLLARGSAALSGFGFSALSTANRVDGLVEVEHHSPRGILNAPAWPRPVARVAATPRRSSVAEARGADGDATNGPKHFGVGAA